MKPEPNRETEVKLDIGLAVLLTMVGVVLLAVLLLALMAFAPVILALLSAWIAWTEWRRTRRLGLDHLGYRWLGRFWFVAFWSILGVAGVLIFAAWMEYALVYNEIRVAIATAWHKYTWPYLWTFGGVFVLVLLVLGVERAWITVRGRFEQWVRTHE